MPGAEWWFYVVMSIVSIGFGWLGGYLRHRKTREHVTDEMKSLSDVFLNRIGALASSGGDVASLQARNDVHRKLAILFFKKLSKDEQDEALQAITMTYTDFSTRIAGKGPNAISDDAEKERVQVRLDILQDTFTDLREVVQKKIESS